MHGLDPRLVSVDVPARKSLDLGVPAPASTPSSILRSGSHIGTGCVATPHEIVPTAAATTGKAFPSISAADNNSTTKSKYLLPTTTGTTRPNRLGLSLASPKSVVAETSTLTTTAASRVGAFGTTFGTGSRVGLGGSSLTSPSKSQSISRAPFALSASPATDGAVKTGVGTLATNGGEKASQLLASGQGISSSDLGWSAQNKMDHQQAQLRVLQDLSAELRGEVVALRQEVKGLRSKSGASSFPIEASHDQRDFEFDSLTNLGAEVHQSYASLVREQASALRNQVTALSDDMAALREACSSAVLSVQTRMEDLEQGCMTRLAAVEGELLNCCHRDEINEIRQEVWKAKDILSQEVQELQGESLRRERLNFDRFDELISKESEERIRHYDTVCQHVEEFRHALQGMERVLRTELNIVYRWRQQCVETNVEDGDGSRSARGTIQSRSDLSGHGRSGPSSSSCLASNGGLGLGLGLRCSLGKKKKKALICRAQTNRFDFG
mmetsp:Transcript_47707/g.102192  ORF Transcript_47707/g.102192 Transcript_47707/m.102192 type:complete len:497 (-) Transcript_47707:1515-3005(-)